MLVLAREKGESVILQAGDDTIEIVVTDIRRGGKIVKLGFNAPQHVIIDRKEISEKKKRERAEQGGP